MSRFLSSFITVVAVMSIFGIFAIIVFSDTILAVRNTDIVISSDDEEEVKVLFETNPLVIDGKDTNLMQGVKATDELGNDITNKVSASVITGNSGKIIVYSINGSEYQLEAYQRNLTLDKYKKPKIVVKQADYSCNINNIESYIKKMIETGAITADDGFGNDISSEIYLSPTNDIEGSGLQVVELVVRNKFDDTAKISLTINVTGKFERATSVPNTNDNNNSNNSNNTSNVTTSTDGAGVSVVIPAGEPGKSQDVPTGDSTTRVWLLSIPMIIALAGAIVMYRKKEI